jgi:serine/threonine protein phosphatase PrpC
MANDTKNRESREAFEMPTIEVSFDSLVSPKHPDRNEDAVLGDTRRLTTELSRPPKMDTEPLMVAKDYRTMKEAREKESANAEKLKERQVYGLLDGVSGSTGNGSGALASRISSAVIAEKMAELPPDADVETTKRQIETAMRAADQAVLEYKADGGRDQEHADLSEMSSTADIIRVIDKKDGTYEMAFGHVGDSRIYVFRAETGKLECLTIDHNAAGYFHLKARNPKQRLTKEEYDRVMNADSADELSDDEKPMSTSFMMREGVYNALGREAGTLEVETKHVTLKKGDKIFLSSDGIHDNLKDSEIEGILRDGGTVNDLIARAGEFSKKRELRDADGKRLFPRAKPDDISGLLIELGKEGGRPEQRESIADKMATWKEEIIAGETAVAALERLRLLALPVMKVGGDRGRPSRLPASREDAAEIQRLGGLKGIESLQRQWKLYTLARRDATLRQEIGSEILEQIDKKSREADECERKAVTVESAVEAAKFTDTAKTARKALESMMADMPSIQELRGVQAEMRKLQAEWKKEEEDRRAEAERQARKKLE